MKVLAAKLADVDMNGLRDLGDQLKEKLGEGVVVLASVQRRQGKPDGHWQLTSAMKTGRSCRKPDQRQSLAIVGGGGGGRPNMAQAGGKNPAGDRMQALKAAAETSGRADPKT